MSLCASLPFLEDLSGIAMSRMMHAQLSLRSPSPQTEFEAHGYRVERSASTEIRHQAAVCAVSLINTHKYKTASMTSLCASGQLLGSRPSVRLSRHANRQTCRWVKDVYASSSPCCAALMKVACAYLQAVTTSTDADSSAVRQ